MFTKDQVLYFVFLVVVITGGMWLGLKVGWGAALLLALGTLAGAVLWDRQGDHDELGERVGEIAALVAAVLIAAAVLQKFGLVRV